MFFFLFHVLKSLCASNLEMLPCHKILPCYKMLCTEIFRKWGRKRDFLSSACHNKVLENCWVPRSVNWDMLENALRMTVVLVGQRITLISAISSTDVNARSLVWMALRGAERRQKKKGKSKLKLKMCDWFTALSFLQVCLSQSDTKPVLYQVWMKCLTPLTLDWLWMDVKEILCLILM